MVLKKLKLALILSFTFSTLADSSAVSGIVHEKTETGDVHSNHSSDEKYVNGEKLAWLIYNKKKEEVLNILSSSLQLRRINTPWRFGLTALHAASVRGYADISAMLINLGANVNARDDHGKTPLYYSSNKETADILLSTGAGINDSGDDKRTPLHKAVYENNMELVLFLTSRGASVHIRDKYKNTPLHTAVVADSVAIAKVLIEQYGAEVNAKNRRLDTPLHLSKTEDMTQTLINLGADIHSQNIKGMTPLHTASLKGRSETASILIDNQAGIHAKDRKKNTPLHLAATASVVHLLADHGANIFAKNIFGETPLKIAVFFQHEHAVFALIQRGANSRKRLFPKDFGTKSIEIANIILRTEEIRENYVKEQNNKKQSGIKKLFSSCMEFFSKTK